MTTPQTGDTVTYRGRTYVLVSRSPHGGYNLERNGQTIHTMGPVK